MMVQNHLSLKERVLFDRRETEKTRTNFKKIVERKKMRERERVRVENSADVQEMNRIAERDENGERYDKSTHKTY